MKNIVRSGRADFLKSKTDPTNPSPLQRKIISNRSIEHRRGAYIRGDSPSTFESRGEWFLTFANEQGHLPRPQEEDVLADVTGARCCRLPSRWTESSANEAPEQPPRMSSRFVRRSFGKQIGLAVPLMREVAHDERVVEGDAARRECRLVGEERGLDVLDFEWPHLPAVGLKANPIESAAIAGDRVANAAALEVGRRLGK